MTPGRGRGWAGPHGATGVSEKCRGHWRDQAGFAGVAEGWPRGPLGGETPNVGASGGARDPGAKEGDKVLCGETARAEPVALSWRWGSLGRVPAWTPEGASILGEPTVTLPLEGRRERLTAFVWTRTHTRGSFSSSAPPVRDRPGCGRGGGQVSPQEATVAPPAGGRSGPAPGGQGSPGPTERPPVLPVRGQGGLREPGTVAPAGEPRWPHSGGARPRGRNSLGAPGSACRLASRGPFLRQ